MPLFDTFVIIVIYRKKLKSVPSARLKLVYPVMSSTHPLFHTILWILSMSLFLKALIISTRLNDFVETQLFSGCE